MAPKKKVKMPAKNLAKKDMKKTKGGALITVEWALNPTAWSTKQAPKVSAPNLNTANWQLGQ